MSEQRERSARRELMRVAADQMRIDAEGATPGPWEPYPDERGLSDVASHLPERSVAMLEGGTMGSVASRAYDRDAAFISHWHPEIALRVADWLDQHAEDHSCYECRWDGCAGEILARAYLGRDS